MTTPPTSDAELAAQPAAYWTGVAYEALISFTRARQAELGFTQPQFWLLRNLSEHDISPDGHGMTIPELQQAMRSTSGPRTISRQKRTSWSSAAGSPATPRDGCGSLSQETRLVPASGSTAQQSGPASTRASTMPTT